MATLSIFTPTFSPAGAPVRSRCYSFPQTQLCHPIFCPKLIMSSLSVLPRKRNAAAAVVFSSNSDDPKLSLFLDEKGVVDDMDGYLNQLSLEYDSVWDTKPAWCQPWTITLTGVLIIAGSWLVFHSVVVSSLALSLIGAWWYVFLYSYPKAYTDMIAERRKKVTSGVEDTFGSRKSQ